MPEELKAEAKVITTKPVTLTCKDKASAECLAVYDSKKFSEGKKELTFDVKSCPKDKSWRLVHDGKQVLMLFESDGETHTARELFVGTEKECGDEVKRLGLKSSSILPE